MKRALGPAAFGVVLAASLAHCSAGSAAAGTVGDGGLACGPVDVTGSGYDGVGGVPEIMRPPRRAHLGACTPQQVVDYAKCQGAKDLALCPQFAKGGASAICGTCVESQHDAIDGGPAPSWGIIVFDSKTGTASFNVEGCVDDALNQVPDELANNAGQGPGSCGDLLHASYGCQEAACSACTGSPLGSCAPLPTSDAGDAGDATASDATVSDATVSDATVADAADDAARALDASPLDAGDDAGTCTDFVQCEAYAVAPGKDCNFYDARVQDPSGPCAALLGDAAPPDVQNCFPDADPSKQWTQQEQEVDWLTRIVGYMCGS